jgi:DNA-directed RNA polymerase subunit omega
MWGQVFEKPDPAKTARFPFRQIAEPYPTMNSELVRAANRIIPNQHILVNMISRRVRQLTLGHRPLVEFVPGMGHADIALTEITNGKLEFESTKEESLNSDATTVDVVQFPGVIVTKKAKRAAAAAA